MAQPAALVLGAVQHPLAQLSEAGATIGLSLDQLQALNMPLDWTLAPFEREPGSRPFVAGTQREAVVSLPKSRSATAVQS